MPPRSAFTVPSPTPLYRQLCIQTHTYIYTYTCIAWTCISTYICIHGRGVFSAYLRWFHRWLKRKRTQKLQRRCGHCFLKDDSEGVTGAELCENCKLRDWVGNYRLDDVNSFSLFNEFLEMGVCCTHMHTLLHTTLTYFNLFLCMLIVNLYILSLVIFYSKLYFDTFLGFRSCYYCFTFILWSNI